MSVFKKHQSIGVNDWGIILLGGPLLAFLVPLLFYGISVHEMVICFAQSWFVGVPYVWFMWIGDRAIMMAVHKRYPELHQNMKRLLISCAIIIVYTTLITLGMEWFIKQSPDTENLFVKNASFSTALGSNLFSTAAIISIYEALMYWSQLKQQLVITERLKKENAQAQLDSLKNQVNPHFLFNSLNTLAGIIPEDSDKAVQFVQQLSTLYRHLLDLNEKQVVTLEEELELLNSYLFLIRTRFDHSIDIQLEIAPESNQLYLIPLSLQMLVENAVKHNVISQKKPLHIRIYTDDNGFVCVHNNFHPKQQPVEGTGTGLENINSRFMLTFDKQILVHKTEHVFEVKLPLISIQELS
jgi:two-component system, LytTR family, sensor kinase